MLAYLSSHAHMSNQRSKETQALGAAGSLELDASCSSYKIHLFRRWAIDLIMLAIALKIIHILGCLKRKNKVIGYVCTWVKIDTRVS